MAFLQLPKGSILSIQGLDALAMDTNVFNSTVAARNGLTYTDRTTATVYRRVSEHNRTDFQVGTNRIEKVQRMSNGLMRKFFIADKKTFSVSWQMLPSFRTETVDGAWGAEDLKSFYESIAGQGEFNIRINYASNAGDTDNTATYDVHKVVFTNASFDVVKRGIQPFWNVNITLEEV
jgi:hypothetical protein